MYFMSDPQALHVTRDVIPGKLGVDLHLHRVHIPLVCLCEAAGNYRYFVYSDTDSELVVQSDDLDLLTAWHLHAWYLRSINDLTVVVRETITK